MKKILFFLSLFFFCSACMAGSRLKNVSITITNTTGATWHLVDIPQTTQGKVSPGNYETLLPNQSVSISAKGNYDGPEPHFSGNFTYMSDSKLLSIRIFSQGAQLIKADLLGQGVGITKQTTLIMQKCQGLDIAGACMGYTYYDCKFLLTLGPPPIKKTQLVLKGSFSRADLSNWAQQINANLTPSFLACGIPISPNHYVTYALDAKNKQAIFTFRTNC